jgi:hypothetical protein
VAQETFTMSIHQPALESGAIYQVVGTRTTGEQVMISERVDRTVAEMIRSLMQSSGHYSDIFIECDGTRLASHGDA